MAKRLSQAHSMPVAVVALGFGVLLATAWSPPIASATPTPATPTPATPTPATPTPAKQTPATPTPATPTSGGSASGVLSVSPEIDTSWRYTKFGWQNSSSWVSPKAYIPRQTVERLHPFVWAGIVLISVVATMIWASNEWDLARLLRHDKETTELEAVRPSELADNPLEPRMEAIRS